PAPAAEAPRQAAPRSPSGVVLRTLTEEEREARAKALSGAKEREEDDRRRAEQEARARAEREEREREERAAAEARKKEEEARRLQEQEAKRRAEQEATRRLSGGEPAPVAPPSNYRRPSSAPSSAPSGYRPSPSGPRPSAPSASLTPAAPRPVEEEDGKRIIRRPGLPTKVVMPARPSTRPSGPQKDRGRLTVASATGDAAEERTRSVASFRRRTQRLKGHQTEHKEKIAREITLPETITIQELANRMSERAVDVIKLLMKQGQMATINDVIDADTAQLIAEELGHTVKRVAESDVEEGLFDSPDDDSHLLPRPPVVTIMGHVDHGKTSLLDALRHANVQSGEAGGITQHIGAYQVTTPEGQPITFIDTPGHAAFTQMRARGAKVTDIVVLVVAADDGVMPQTKEAIAHAKAAGVPIIVAINKIDKPEAKPERVRGELTQYEIQVESLGGDILEVEVSALKKTNLDKLLEAITLQAEVLDLKANPDRPAEGTVVESRLDRGRGPVATVLVQRGTLRVGDLVVGGTQWGKVRALLDDKGEHVTAAGPSFPVEILGFSGSPEAGDRVGVVESEARAREITDYRERQKREKAAARVGGARSSLVDMMSQLKTAGKKEFPVVIKADVQGSAEAIVSTLEDMNTDEVAVRVLQAGVGGVTESDVTLAEASKAVIIGFNVRALKEARTAAEQAGIEIRYYNIIYNLVDDVKAAMSGMLDPTLREDMLGNAQILEIFNISKVGKIAGCRVTDGKVERGAHVRLIRDSVVVHEGRLSTLKRFKDEVKDVVAGQECGMAFENYQDMRVGDIIECYNVTEIKRTL
ncbi:MAG: translation initiation factor IF-2, partial [Beijerinckiaceae bacterium]|nr:translation initiation factor IF-2 [Beijerinckiaceae bacterium]